jgi:hypothetical protein
MPWLAVRRLSRATVPQLPMRCSLHYHSTFVHRVIAAQLSSNFRPRFVLHPSPFCLTSVAIPSNVRPQTSIHRHSFVVVHPHWRTVFFKLYVLCTYIFDIIFFKPYLVFYIFTKFWVWDNTMSSDDESTTTQPELKYPLWNNTQSFEPISLNSQSSQ